MKELQDIWPDRAHVLKTKGGIECMVYLKKGLIFDRVNVFMWIHDQWMLVRSRKRLRHKASEYFYWEEMGRCRFDLKAE